MTGNSQRDTKFTLKQEVLDSLIELLTLHYDTGETCNMAAEASTSSSLAHTFRQHAECRKRLASELTDILVMNGVVVDSHETLRGKAHRFWMQLQQYISNGDPDALLPEIERAEEFIRSKYQQTLQRNAGSPISDILHRHYRELKGEIQQLHDLQSASDNP